MYRLILTLSLFFITTFDTNAMDQAIQLETSTGVIKGTLTTPSGVGQVPVVLLIAGSGPTDRDGNTTVISGKNDSLKMVAAALADKGFASVRYDKRGIAASVGAAITESQLRFDIYVQDAASWIRKLSQDSRFRGVVVLGHSEGSLIGMLASQINAAQAFISVAGPSEKASSILRRQLKARLPLDLIHVNDEILRSLENRVTVSEVPAPLMVFYRPSIQPYLISWFQFSPAKEIAKLHMPCQILQGGRDIQVRSEDAKALKAANVRCTLNLVGEMNHVLKRVPLDQNEQVASYSNPSLALDSDFVENLVTFLPSEQVVDAFRGAR
jgi:uncharacterized protein